jgi:hypothetical protein
LTCGRLSERKERRQSGVLPVKKSEPKIMQPVVRRVQERAFVHFYLACGHMITMRKEKLVEGSFPSLVECWACENEAKKKDYVM